MRKFELSPRKLIILLFFTSAVVFRIWVSQPTWLHYDENYYLNIAKSYSIRGELTPYMWRLGDTNIISGSGSGYGVILLSIWLNLVNGSLYLGRLFMVLIGLLSAGLVFLISRNWWGSTEAGLVSLAFSLVITSSFYTMTIRMDALGILTYCLVLLLFQYSIKPGSSPWLSFLLGIVGVITFEFHMIGVIYLSAFGFYYLVFFIKDIHRTRSVLFQHPANYFFMGSVLASAFYYWVHIMPDPNAYFIISQTCFECDESILITETKRIVRLLFFRPIDLLLLFSVTVVSFWQAWRMKGRNHRRYVILVSGWILAQAIIGPPPYDHYASHFWPLLALGIGGLIPASNNLKGEVYRANIALFVSFIILVLNLAMFITSHRPYFLSYQPEETSSIRYILGNLPEESVIMGRVPSYYLLRDYTNFLTYRDGELYGVKLRNESLEVFWAREQPDVILVDEQDVKKDFLLQNLLHEEEFIQIYSDLWIKEHLFPNVTFVQIEPEVLKNANLNFCMQVATPIE